MTIESVVTEHIADITAYGVVAQADAHTAMDVLSDMDFPIPSSLIIGYTPLRIIDPDVPAYPSALNLDTAPVIAALAKVDRPDKPTIDAVTLGTLLSITLPNIPSVEFPSLSIEAPIYSITAPTNWDFVVEDILISDDPMVAAAITRLSSNISSGGTGLSASVEADIWDRDKERGEQQLEDSTDKMAVMWAKKGFSLPDGMLAHSLAELQKEYMNKSLDRSREIAVKQAELEQSNLFKSLELSVSLAFKLIESNIHYADLVFRGQEATAKFANEYIELQIKTYASLLDAYKTTAQVHETMVRAEMAKVDLYKAQLEGQKLIGDINEQTVKVYVEQIRATVVLMDRYKTEVDAMVAELGVEKAKVEVNKLQMDAWAKKADATIARFGGEVDLYKAASQVSISVAELQTKAGEANLRATLAANELALKNLEVNERSNQAYAGLRVEAAKGVASVAATLAAGAMAAMNAQAALAYEETKPISGG
jgi:hypothetical protein